MTEPFSRVYCLPSERQQDSNRFRLRLGKFTPSFKPYKEHIIQRIELETGTRVPWYSSQFNLDRYFQIAELRDVLDSITHIYDSLIHQAGVADRFTRNGGSIRILASEWRTFAKRVFAEEHTTYEVDEACRVRYAVDEAYALNRKATLSCLAPDRWAAVRAEFERAFAALDGEPQDTNGAVRAVAAAVESCAKIVTGNGMARLGPAEIQRYLRPICESVYAGDQVAIDSTNAMLKSLSEWVNASHQYRHGQGASNEVHAPLELAIQFLTSGTGFIRWLVTIESKRTLEPA